MENITLVEYDPQRWTGVKRRFKVYAGDTLIAHLRRSFLGDWRYTDRWYGEDIGPRFKTVAQAKKALPTIEFPTEEQVYEGLCAATAIERRKYAEAKHAPELFRLTRLLVDNPGSNEARAQLADLLAEVERFALDRTNTFENDRDNFESGFPHYPERARVNA